MQHSIGKGPTWSFLETEILRKIGEMVKTSKKLFSLFWSVGLPETPLCWQNTKKVTPGIYSHLILHSSKELFWLISVTAIYSEYKAMQKQVLHSQKARHIN